MAGRTLFLTDRGLSQFRAFDAETDPGLRNDIAAGIAEAGNATSSGHVDAMQVTANRARLLDVLAGTSDVAVRRQLLRASLRGLNCIVPSMLDDARERARAARFIHDVITNEPDARVRERLEQFARLIEIRGAGAIPSFARIMNS